MPITFVSATAEASFLAYLHYLEDIDGVIAGRYGRGPAGVYETMRLHPPVLELPQRVPAPHDLRVIAGYAATAWSKLDAIGNATAEDTFDRQANAVVPALAIEAVTAAAAALATALGTDAPATPDDALTFLSDFVTEELLPYPWSAFCSGCPQTGSTLWGGSVLPGDAISVFQPPTAQTSDARFAMLLRTTRQRSLEARFTHERHTDVRPGRTRRNLTLEHKEAIATITPPTTLFDVLERVRARVDADDGEAFVEAPFDDEEALRFATALAAVTDASVAVVEAVVATVIGWELVDDLARSHARRHGSAASASRAAACPGT